MKVFIVLLALVCFIRVAVAEQQLIDINITANETDKPLVQKVAPILFSVCPSLVRNWADVAKATAKADSYACSGFRSRDDWPVWVDIRVVPRAKFNHFNVF